jgi:hypothetical protein
VSVRVAHMGTNCARRDAELAAEPGCKVTRCLESDVERNVERRAIAALEQLAGDSCTVVGDEPRPGEGARLGSDRRHTTRRAEAGSNAIRRLRDHVVPAEQAALKPQLRLVPASAELYRPATPNLVLHGTTRSVGPSVRIIDRSMTLRSSRTLPLPDRLETAGAGAGVDT